MMRFDPLSPLVLPNPYPHYAHLRRHDPIHWGTADDAGLPGRWYIVRHADVMSVLKDHRFGREVEKVLPPTAVQPPTGEEATLRAVAEHWMILRDPPIHTRLRGLVSSFFTPRRVLTLRTQIERVADQLIDRMVLSGPPHDL